MSNKTMCRTRMKHKKNNKGVSPVIATIMISGSLLIILMVAAFVATSVLNLQVSNTEFEQAKTNMLLLDEIIQSVALRRGSGDYVQFNQRSGGINLLETEQNIEIIGPGEESIYESPNLITLVYQGGSLSGGADLQLRGNNSLLVDMGDVLSYVRTEIGSGVQVELDYNRVRLTETGKQIVGNEQYNFIEICLIRLTKGITTGSGIINVKAQNINVNTTSHVYNNGTVTIEAQLGSATASQEIVSDADKTVVLFTEIEMQISTS